MDSTLKREIVITVKSEEEQMEIANSIHHQLVGNRDYKDSNIVLNIDKDNTVRLYIFEECEEIPDIVL